MVEGQTKLISTELEPNENVTVQYGPKALTTMVFDALEMDRPLSALKRKQGASVSEVCIALVSRAMQDRGLSINRLEDVIEDDDVRAEYGLSEDVDKNDLYRTGQILGENIDPIIRHMNTMLKSKFGMEYNEVFMDWSATYLDGKPTKFVRFGHTKDHRPDRPQVAIGLSMHANSDVPIGLTVVTGNTVDVTHFEKTFRQIKPFLDPECLIVFDNGGYSKDNAKLITEAGFDFLTRAQMNKSNDKQISSSKTEWEYLGDDMCACTFRGNLGYTKCIYFSASKYFDAMEKYRRKAEHDYDEMLEIRKALDGKRKLRKKYRNGNVFVNTVLYRQFPLDDLTREEAIEYGFRSQISGREGYFILMSSRKMTASEMLSMYRDRNDVEDAFRDLKHGIDLRPLRCTDESSIKGRVLIAYLAYFVLAFAKMLVPAARAHTAETLVSELNSFSVTLVREKGVVKQRIYSNFRPLFRAILEGFPRIMEAIPRGSRVRKAPRPV